MIRRLKIAYELYNIFHKSELIRNVQFYRKYGIHKKYYSSISSEDFKHLNGEEIANIGRDKNIEDIEYYNTWDQQVQESIKSFDDLGYCVIPNFLDAETVDKVNTEIEDLLKSGKIQYKYVNKLMFAIHKSPYLGRLWKNHPFNELLNYLIKGNAELFQSINFLHGSEQETHSDSIHMTTFPLGGLLGVWIALEDIDEENGPIHYYPESHKLPYYMNGDYNNVGSRFMLGDKGYTAYEAMIKEKIASKKINKEVFTASKGDMFIWHANLLHGGEPHINKDRNRKSMVLHYFDSRRICYHEITQRPALIKRG